MLDFRQASRRQPYWTRRQQLIALGVVVLAGIIFGVSRDWGGWLKFLGATGGHNGSATRSDRSASAIDTRVPSRPLDRELPGTFLSPLGPEAIREPAPPSRYFPGVMPSYLESIRDDSPFAHAEKDAWFNLLNVLQKTDIRKLTQASTGRVTFVQLYRQAEEYRGELVTVRGVLRAAYRVTAPKNDYGIKNYYQTWLTPDDSPDNVEVVYVLRLPPRFPTGDGLAEDVEITGFSFKRWVYRAKDTLRSAPVLLAQTVQWQKRPVLVKKSETDFGTVVAVVAGTAIGAVLLAAYLGRRTGRGKRAPNGEPPSPIAPSA